MEKKIRWQLSGQQCCHISKKARFFFVKKSFVKLLNVVGIRIRNFANDGTSAGIYNYSSKPLVFSLNKFHDFYEWPRKNIQKAASDKNILTEFCRGPHAANESRWRSKWTNDRKTVMKKVSIARNEIKNTPSSKKPPSGEFSSNYYQRTTEFYKK